MLSLLIANYLKKKHTNMDDTDFQFTNSDMKLTVKM